MLRCSISFCVCRRLARGVFMGLMVLVMVNVVGKDEKEAENPLSVLPVRGRGEYGSVGTNVIRYGTNFRPVA